ncbi:hypothetical protein ACOMHN_060320 [Nucella lapillus]
MCTAGWRRVISIGAIDCVDDKNLVICREYDIQGYPEIRLFPPRYVPKPTKDDVKLLSAHDPEDMKEEVLKHLTAPAFSAPSTWPRLAPLRSLGDIWNETKDEHTFVMVIFENEDSLVGREVMLDLVDFPTLLIRRMLKKDVEKFGTFTYPSLYSINKDSTFQLLASGWPGKFDTFTFTTLYFINKDSTFQVQAWGSGLTDKDRHAFGNKLLSLLHLEDSQGRRIRMDPQGGGGGGHRPADRGNVVQFEQPDHDTNAPPTPAPSLSASSGVHLQDLESALHYTFRQEIAICKTIDGPKLDALRNFIAILAKFFPGRPQVSRYLWKLSDQLHQGVQSLTGESWGEMIDRLQDKEAWLPDKARWVGCRGSQPRYRGYPCSMWTLFHTLTVAAYEHTGSAVNAQEVPLAIRAYMKHFFGCKECSKHFTGMAVTMEKEIHRPLDAVVWLWHAHNKANKRLHGDASEDPRHPKVQFPSKTDCPKCHDGKNSSTDGWDVSAVALYLLEFYGKDHIIQDAGHETTEELERDGGREEMDWWEKQQRQIDLKKLEKIREQKKKRKLEKRIEAKNAWLSHVPMSSVGATKAWRRRKHPDLIKESVRSRSLREGWGLNNLDVGVCLVFNVSCAVIILMLYYHFVVQKRFRLPCKNLLPV